MYLPFSLSRPVSPQRHSGQNTGLDTLKMQQGLQRLGYFEPEQPTYVTLADDKLFGAVKDFQNANDLNVDGIANPGGPTEAALNRSLVQAPAKPILSAPIADAAPGVRYKNERSLPSLDNHTDPGDLPMLMAGTLLSEDGDKAAPEVADLLRQTFERDQDMGLKMRNNLAEVLDPADMAKMDEAANIPAEARKASVAAAVPDFKTTLETNPKPDSPPGDKSITLRDATVGVANKSIAVEPELASDQIRPNFDLDEPTTTISSEGASYYATGTATVSRPEGGAALTYNVDIRTTKTAQGDKTIAIFEESDIAGEANGSVLHIEQRPDGGGTVTILHPGEDTPLPHDFGPDPGGEDRKKAQQLIDGFLGGQNGFSL